MKIRRITLAVLALLTLLFIMDVRYFGGGQNTINRSVFHFEITPRESAMQAEKSQDFRRSQGELTSFTITGKQGVVQLRSTDGDEIIVRAAIKASLEEDLEGWEVTEKIIDSEIRYELLGPTNVLRQVGVNYVVEVPAGMDVGVTYDYGVVRVEEFVGFLDIKTTFSQVVVRDLVGSAQVTSHFGAVKLQEIAGPLVLEALYSSSSIELLSIEGGYNFEIEINNGSLGGNAPLRKEQMQNRIQAEGSIGEGLHPVVIQSGFGNVNVNLK